MQENPDNFSSLKLNLQDYSEEFIEMYRNNNTSMVDKSKTFHREVPNLKCIQQGNAIIGIVDDSLVNNESDEEDDTYIDSFINDFENEFRQDDVIEEDCSDNKISLEELFHKESSNQTVSEYTTYVNNCREIFTEKLNIYGPSWRVIHPESVSDQIYIRINKILNMYSYEKEPEISEIISELNAIINYSVIYLIQFELGKSNTKDISNDKAIEYFDNHLQSAYDLMIYKNHSYYNESWRMMRLCSYLDTILMKIIRIREVELMRDELSNLSIDIKNNFYDIINYAIFTLIKIC